MKVRLDKIESNHNNLSRNFYTGHSTQLPTVGHRFTMDTEEAGYLITTPVVSYSVSFPDKLITFKTKNSTYTLTLEG